MGHVSHSGIFFSFFLLNPGEDVRVEHDRRSCTCVPSLLFRSLSRYLVSCVYEKYAGHVVRTCVCVRHKRHVVFIVFFSFFAYMAMFRHVDGRSPFLILTFDCFDLHVLSFFLLFFSLKTINVSNDKVYLSLNLTHFTI